MVKFHADPLVIIALVSNFRTRRIMVDTGSSVDELFRGAFQKMGIDRDSLRLMKTLLVRLAGHKVEPTGTIHLTLTIQVCKGGHKLVGG